MGLYVLDGVKVYEPDEDNLIHAFLKNNRILSGCGVTAQGSPNMTVAYAGGTILSGGAVVTSAASASLAIGANGTSDPRIDMVVIDLTTGAASIVAGNAAPVPKPLALPAGKILAAYVSVAPAAANIQTSNITDRRLIGVIAQVAGTLANRPAAAAANVGLFYFATDEAGGILYRDNGGAWVAVTVGASWLKKGADIASAATITPGTDGAYAHITGTTTITGIASLPAGRIFIAEFDGALTLTHNGTSLILQGATNYVTTPGDVFMFISEGSGNWRELSRRPATAAGATDLDFNRWEYAWYAETMGNSSVTGSGTANLQAAQTSAALATGVTNPSSAGLRTLFTTQASTLMKKLRVLRMRFVTAGTVNVRSYAFCTNENATGSPSLTAEHFGIKQVNAVVSFTTADGTTEQVTDISAFMSATADNHITIEFDGTTATCYVNGVLRATHATNVPISNTLIFPAMRFYIDNNNTAQNTSLYIAAFNAKFAT